MKFSFGLTLLTSGLLSATCAVRAESVTYQYITIDAPGAVYSSAFGINNMGEIVGSGDTQGFLDNHGVFTTIDAPGSVTTLLTGINDRAQITVAAGGPYASYVYSGGTFTPVQVPGAQLVQANGINNAGQVVGYYNISGFSSQGFVNTDGVITTLSMLGAGTALARGISNTGKIVGTTNGLNSFLYIDGAFTPISAPNGSLATYVSGINSSGQIVGTLDDSNRQQHAFVDTGGVFAYVDFPGGRGSNAFGINDAGQIVGNYEDSFGNGHGFLATPASPASVPEPASLPLFVGGLAGLGIAIRSVQKPC